MATVQPVEELPVEIIRPARGWVGFNLGELWHYRELLLFLTWRTVLVRYKQTVLGIAWAILQPFFLMVVFTIFFGRLAKVAHSGIPYPIFSYSALIAWTFFANSLTQSSNSLVGSANLISKVYFPRLAIPIAAVLASIVDFAIAFGLLGAMMGWYGYYPRPIAIAVLPALLLLALTTALGVGLWLSALSVAYRDVQYVLSFLTQLWLFATPGVYLASTFSEPWRSLLGLNPMQGVVVGFRWALLGAGQAPGPMVGVSAAVAVVLLVSGAVYFRRTERTFADVI